MPDTCKKIRNNYKRLKCLSWTFTKNNTTCRNEWQDMALLDLHNTRKCNKRNYEQMQMPSYNQRRHDCNIERMEEHVTRKTVLNLAWTAARGGRDGRCWTMKLLNIRGPWLRGTTITLFSLRVWVTWMGQRSVGLRERITGYQGANLRKSNE